MSFKKLISFKSLIPIVLIALVFLIVWQLNLQMQKKTPRSIGNDAPLSKKTNFSEQDYKHYVQAFKKIQSNHYVTKKSTQIGLKITAIRKNVKSALWAPLSAVEFDHSLGCIIYDNGTIDYFQSDDFGTKGGSGTLEKSELSRLYELLRELPDDNSYLPPEDRRLILQSIEKESIKVQIYDLANVPEELFEILHISKSGIRPLLPHFKAEKKLSAHEHDDGALTLSPDKKFVISSSLNGPLKFWDQVTMRLINEVLLPENPTPTVPPKEDIVFSPDGSIAVIGGWGEYKLYNVNNWTRIKHLAEPVIERKRHLLSFPRFNPDGKYLFLQSSEPNLIVYETTNWNKLKTLRWLPENLHAYIPATKRKRGIILSALGELALWDSDMQQKYAKLDENVCIQRIAFSPDETLIAIATSTPKGCGGNQGHYRIRIWKMDTGDLVHELRPFEQTTCRDVNGLVWSNDGNYLLAATQSDNFFTSRNISVWNINNGRHRGELIGCPTKVTGFELLSDGQLVSGCKDGTIRFWNLKNIINNIQKFEFSINKISYE